MANDEQIDTLLKKWVVDADDFRTEARRLEASDPTRHAASIAALEARSQGIDRCVIELERLSKLSSALI